MKSMGLALTIFALTGALAGLDLSGTHPVQKIASTVVQNDKAITAAVAAADSIDRQEKMADDEEDEGEDNLVKTLLITPRTLPAATDTVTALRYD